MDTCQVDDKPNIGNACANIEKFNSSKQKIKKVGKAHAYIKYEMDSAGLASKMVIFASWTFMNIAYWPLIDEIVTKPMAVS